jgi:hypothetical protein
MNFSKKGLFITLDANSCFYINTIPFYLEPFKVYFFDFSIPSYFMFRGDDSGYVYNLLAIQATMGYGIVSL